MAIKFTTDGRREQVTISPDLSTGLDEMGRHVGGHIEIVRLVQTRAALVALVVNDDGHRDLPLNPLASALAGQVIMGDALLVLVTAGGTDAEGWH